MSTQESRSLVTLLCLLFLSVFCQSDILCIAFMLISVKYFYIFTSSVILDTFLKNDKLHVGNSQFTSFVKGVDIQEWLLFCCY